MRKNPKKDRQARRPRVQSPPLESFIEVVRGQGTPQEEVVLMAQRADGIWFTRTKSPRRSPLRHISIPRRPIGLIRDPWHGQGKYKRNVQGRKGDA